MTALDGTGPDGGMAANPLAALLTISDVARRYGATLRALRFYEDRGLLKPLRHGTTRFYDGESCRRLEIILRGKHLGYTLTEIADLLARDGADGPGCGARAAEVEAQIERLTRKRDDLDGAIAELRALHARAMGAAGTGAASTGAPEEECSAA